MNTKTLFALLALLIAPTFGRVNKCGKPDVMAVSEDASYMLVSLLDFIVCDSNQRIMTVAISNPLVRQYHTVRNDSYR